MGRVARGEIPVLLDLLEIFAHLARFPGRISSSVDNHIPIVILWQQGDPSVVHGAATQYSGPRILDTQVLMTGLNQYICIDVAANEAYLGGWHGINKTYGEN